MTVCHVRAVSSAGCCGEACSTCPPPSAGAATSYAVSHFNTAWGGAVFSFCLPRDKRRAPAALRALLPIPVLCCVYHYANCYACIPLRWYSARAGGTRAVPDLPELFRRTLDAGTTTERDYQTGGTLALPFRRPRASGRARYGTAKFRCCPACCRLARHRRRAGEQWDGYDALSRRFCWRTSSMPLVPSCDNLAARMYWTVFSPPALTADELDWKNKRKHHPGGLDQA